jgi:hypothetical protein
MQLIKHKIIQKYGIITLIILSIIVSIVKPTHTQMSYIAIGLMTSITIVVGYSLILNFKEKPIVKNKIIINAISFTAIILSLILFLISRFD